MDHYDIRRALEGSVAAVLEDKGLPCVLRPYQVETFQRFGDWLADKGATHRSYISHATGLGKTVWFSSLARHCSDLRVLVVEPTKMLVEQTVRTMTQFCGGMIGHQSSLGQIHDRRGQVVAVRGHEFTNVVVTTDESFVTRAPEFRREFDPDLIIWDECHWAYHSAASAALALFDRAVIVGLSATTDFLTNVSRGGSVPVVMDNGQVLYCPPQRLAATHFHSLVDERSVRWAIESGWLAPLAWAQLELNLKLNEVPVTPGLGGEDYNEAKLQQAMETAWPTLIDAVCKLYGDESYGLIDRQVFAVCPSVRAGRELAYALSSIGVPAACVDGGTPDRDRNIILNAFDQKEFRFLSSVMVLREGWDADAEVCLMLRPTRSRIFYLQSMGRVLRPSPDGGYKVSLVVDIKTRDQRFTPLSTPTLFAPPGSEVKEREILMGPRKTTLGAHGKSSSLVSPYATAGMAPKLIHVPVVEVEYWASASGTFEADGKTWGTPAALSLLLPVSAATIDRRGKEARENGMISSRTARVVSGRSCTFYRLDEIQTLCNDLLKTDRIQTAGWFEEDGEVWVAKYAAPSLLSLLPNIVDVIVSNFQVRRRDAKPQRGRVTTYYCLSDLRRVREQLHSSRERASSS